MTLVWILSANSWQKLVVIVMLGTDTLRAFPINRSKFEKIWQDDL